MDKINIVSSQAVLEMSFNMDTRSGRLKMRQRKTRHRQKCRGVILREVILCLVIIRGVTE